MITFTFRDKPLSIFGDTFIYDDVGYHFTQTECFTILDFMAKNDCSREEREFILSKYQLNRHYSPNEENQFPQNADNLREDDVGLYLYGSQNDDLLIFLLQSYAKGKYSFPVRLDKFIKMRQSLSSRVLDEIVFNEYPIAFKTAIVNFELEEKHYSALLTGEDADVIKIALRPHINDFDSNRFEKLLATPDIAYDRMVLFNVTELPQYIREALCVRYSYFLNEMTRDYFKDVLPKAYIKRLTPLIAFAPIINRLNSVHHS